MKRIIAGPCAAESKEQIQKTINDAQKRNLWGVRISLWKPRTEPGFDGLKEEGISLFGYAIKKGIVPATEVVSEENVKEILKIFPDSEILFWIGSRNQNHFLQREIAKEVSKNKKAFLLVKNQPWEDKKHWLGIIKHIKGAGINHEKIILCHRGFFSSKNINGFRNVPNYKMAMEIKKETGLPVIIDPSHIGGSVENIFKVVENTRNYNFDGMMIEVHPNPKKAVTDAMQQLSWEEFDYVMRIYS
jgi:3-deoxy-D-arabino-heptulosonate 7-phosphate (DAHP) synthase